MRALIIRMLISTVPLLILVAGVTITEMMRNHHGRRTLKKLTAGAMRCHWHGPASR